MPTLTATVYPNEAYVLVQTDWSGALFRQTFTTNSASNWPTADTGQIFTVQSGAAGDFTSSGGTGIITHAAANTVKRITVNGLSTSDFSSTGKFTNTVAPTGNSFEIGFGGRWVDGNNFVETRLFFAAAGTVSFSIRQVVAGVETNNGFPAIALPITGVYRWRFSGIGSTLYFRAWLDGSPEPTTWNGTLATTFLSAGTVSYTTTVAAGVTNPMPIIFLFDDLIVTDPNASTTDCAIVTRRNTVTGEVVQLRPYISYDADGALLLDCSVGLWWDTEPPLNVPLEYCTQACDTPTTVTVNPGFEVSTAGWTATGGALTQDCTVAKVGTCSGRLTPGGTLTNPLISQTGFALAADRLVTASAWVMSPQGWNSVLLRLSLTYNDLTTGTFETPLVTLDDNEWRYLSLSFTPALPVTSATFSFIAAGLPPNTTLFNVDELQVTQLTDVAATACATVTVTSTSVWLKSPLHPCDDVQIGLCSPMLADCEETARVSYVGTTDDNYAPNTVLLTPVNRKYPIPVSRVRRGPTATLRLLAHNCEARDAVLAANEPGDPLLFQAPADYCIPDRYISVGAIDETRISVDQREDFRLITLPYATVERPTGPMDGPCGTRIDDLCDIYASWGALAIAGLTWTDLLLGNASTNGPGKVVPAAARTWGEVETEFANWLAVEAGGTRTWSQLRDGL